MLVQASDTVHYNRTKAYYRWIEADSLDAYFYTAFLLPGRDAEETTFIAHHGLLHWFGSVWIRP